MTQTLAQRPHSLYRFFDARGQLLYIGITASLPTRLASHNDEKPWWLDVADIKVEHFPNRESVLTAEKAAIIAERPLHNIQHNRHHLAAGYSAPACDASDVWPGEKAWTFTSRYGYTRSVSLALVWEVYCDPISDDWLIDDISAAELWRLWLTRHPCDENAETIFGPGAFRISWYVEGPGTFEGAPFRDIRVSMEHWRRETERLGHPHGWDDDSHREYEQELNFLAHYTWPVDSQTGEPVQWSRLPVVDKVWRRDNLPTLHTSKGGFIQEATGWKPAPLQPYVNIHQLARMAGLYVPEVCR